MKVQITDNKELLNIVKDGLARNKKLYGKRYCPCRVDRTDDTVCFCKEFREQEVGTTCHCGIYTKTEK